MLKIRLAFPLMSNVSGYFFQLIRELAFHSQEAHEHDILCQYELMGKMIGNPDIHKFKVCL